MQKKFLKQMITFNKTALDNSFSVISALQAQTERMLGIYLEKATGFPEEGKKAMDEWIEAFNKGNRDYRNAVHEHFRKLDNLFEISKR